MNGDGIIVNIFKLTDLKKGLPILKVEKKAKLKRTKYLDTKASKQL